MVTLALSSWYGHPGLCSPWHGHLGIVTLVHGHPGTATLAQPPWSMIILAWPPWHGHLGVGIVTLAWSLWSMVTLGMVSLAQSPAGPCHPAGPMSLYCPHPCASLITLLVAVTCQIPNALLVAVTLLVPLWWLSLVLHLLSHPCRSHLSAATTPSFPGGLSPVGSAALGLLAHTALADAAFPSVLLTPSLQSNSTTSLGIFNPLASPPHPWRLICLPSPISKGDGGAERVTSGGPWE